MTLILPVPPTVQPLKVSLQGDPVGGTLVILIYGDITEDAFFEGGVSARGIAGILSEHPNIAEIEVRINSVGGSAFDGIAIHRLLRQHSASKTVFIDGLAASSASIVAMAGDVIHMGEAAQMMIHNAVSFFRGDKSAFRARADMLSGLDDTAAGLYAGISGKGSDEILALMEAETWFNAEQAVAAGLATDIVDAVDVAASFDINDYNFKNVPQSLRGTPVSQLINKGQRPENTPTQAPMENTDMKILAEAVGLHESASEAQIAVKLEALKTEAKRAGELDKTVITLSDIVAAYDKAVGETGDKALGLIAAHKVSHETLAENTAKLKVIEAKAKTEKHAALVEQGKADGKLTKDLVAMVKDYSVEQLETFLAAMPKVVPVDEEHVADETGTKPKAKSNPGGHSFEGTPYSELSGTDKARMAQVDPAAFKAASAAAIDSYSPNAA